LILFFIAAFLTIIVTGIKTKNVPLPDKLVAKVETY